MNQLPSWAAQLAVFDTETTGLDVAQARVVSSTIALLDSAGIVIERYDWLLNPGIEIPEAAARVHGITTQVAQQSGVQARVGIAQILSRLVEMVERGFPLVVYNAPYDLTLLRAESMRHQLVWPHTLCPVIDPLVLDKQFDRYRKGKRTLEVTAAHYGVELRGAHDAGEDAIAAGCVAQALLRKYHAQLPEQAMQLHQAQIDWAAAQAKNFEQYMRRTKNPNFVAEGEWPVRVIEAASNR